ncbi:hypothetical protein BC30090_p316 (plasmid) [Bacillus cereus]|nr:hypothetical protein BCJMU62_p229 [Bacillus cereus]BCD26892.1 hypothetical protein BC30090_p316 [Bacillus cereus]GMB79185.1 hypothetical protein BCER1_55860 [Bacillus cereus]
MVFAKNTTWSCNWRRKKHPLSIFLAQIRVKVLFIFVFHLYFDLSAVLYGTEIHLYDVSLYKTIKQVLKRILGAFMM